MTSLTDGGDEASTHRSPQKSFPSFAVVVPMHNEEDGAERCVHAVCTAIAALPTRTALIVVDDGSTDSTSKILGSLKSEGNPFAFLSHERNRGYGGALRTGAEHAADAGYDYILFMDSDLTNDPAYLPAFLTKMGEGYDVIKASRYAPGGRTIGVPAWKVLISAFGNRIARLLFGLPLTDSTNGFRAIRTALFSRLDLTEPGFSSIMQEIYQAKFLTRSFCEVPCTLTARSTRLRPSGFSYRPSVLYAYLKYPIRSFLGLAPRGGRR